MVRKIKLETINDVQDFLKLTCKFDCDIDLKSGRYVVDARSIMGIMTLNLSNPVDLVIHDDDLEIEDAFKKWFVEAM